MIAQGSHIRHTSKASCQLCPSRQKNSSELCKLYDLYNQHFWALKESDEYNLDTFLSIVMELKLDKVTKLKWMEFNNDCQPTPPHSERPKFLAM